MKTTRVPFDSSRSQLPGKLQICQNRLRWSWNAESAACQWRCCTHNAIRNFESIVLPLDIFLKWYNYIFSECAHQTASTELSAESEIRCIWRTLPLISWRRHRYLANGKINSPLDATQTPPFGVLLRSRLPTNGPATVTNRPGSASSMFCVRALGACCSCWRHYLNFDARKWRRKKRFHQRH